MKSEQTNKINVRHTKQLIQRKAVSVTFDDQGEVSILEGIRAEADSATVVGIVDPLVARREHVHHPLHGIVWMFPVQIPVEHPLSVPHPIPGPHHTAAYTLEHHPGSSRGAHIIPCHHHTAAAVRLA